MCLEQYAKTQVDKYLQYIEWVMSVVCFNDYHRTYFANRHLILSVFSMIYSKPTELTSSVSASEVASPAASEPPSQSPPSPGDVQVTHSSTVEDIPCRPEQTTYRESILDHLRFSLAPSSCRVTN